MGQVVLQSWAFWSTVPGSSRGAARAGPWNLELGRRRSEGRHAAASARTLLTTPLPWVMCHSVPGTTFGMGARTEEHLGSNGLGRRLIPLLALSSQNLLSALLSTEL